MQAQEARLDQGIVKPIRYVVLRAEAVGQLVPGQLAEEGASLSAGDVIARLEDRGQSEAVALARMQAESDLPVKRAIEAVNELELRLEQAKDMVAQDAGTDWEVRQARVQLELSRIDLAIAKQDQDAAALQFALERARLERFALKAPFDGRVMKLEAQPGATVDQGDPVAVFASLKMLKAELFLPVERYGQMEVGQRYELQAGAPVGRGLTAELTWVDPMIDPASQTFRCVFAIDNSDLSLPAGFLVWLPQEAEALVQEAGEAPAAVAN
ncbi:MAG: HlyD family efflux transporter periplasmic adaptor subunit [Planctomycetota bacterium]